MDCSWLDKGDYVSIESRGTKASGQIIDISPERIILKRANGLKAMFDPEQISSIMQIDGSELSYMDAPGPMPQVFIQPPVAQDNILTQYNSALSELSSLKVPETLSMESLKNYDFLKNNFPQLHRDYNSAYNSVAYAYSKDPTSLNEKIKAAVRHFASIYNECHYSQLLVRTAYLHSLRNDLEDGFCYGIKQMESAGATQQAMMDYFLSNGSLPNAMGVWDKFIMVPHVIIYVINKEYIENLKNNLLLGKYISNMHSSPLAERKFVNLILFALYKKFYPQSTVFDNRTSDDSLGNELYNQITGYLNHYTDSAVIIGSQNQHQQYKGATEAGSVVLIDNAPNNLYFGDVVEIESDGRGNIVKFLSITKKEDMHRGNLKRLNKIMSSSSAPDAKEIVKAINNILNPPRPEKKVQHTASTGNHSDITKKIQSARTPEACENASNLLIDLIENSKHTPGEKRSFVKDLISLRLRKLLLDYDGALNYSEKYMHLFEDAPEEKLQLYRVLVPAYIGKEDYHNAINLLNILIKNKGNAQDYLKLVYCYLQLRMYDESLQYCQKVLSHPKKSNADISAVYTYMFAAYIGKGSDFYDQAEEILEQYQQNFNNAEKANSMRTMLQSAREGLNSHEQLDNFVASPNIDDVYFTPYLDHILTTTGYTQVRDSIYDEALGKNVWLPETLDKAMSIYGSLAEATVFSKEGSIRTITLDEVSKRKIDMVRIAKYCLENFLDENEKGYSEWQRRYIESAGLYMWICYTMKRIESNPIEGTCEFFALESVRMFSRLAIDDRLPEFPEFFDSLNVYFAYSMQFSRGEYVPIDVTFKTAFDKEKAKNVIRENFKRMFENESLYPRAVKSVARLLYHCSSLKGLICGYIDELSQKEIIANEISALLGREISSDTPTDKLFDSLINQIAQSINKERVNDLDITSLTNQLNTLVEKENELCIGSLDIERLQHLIRILRRYCDLHTQNNYELKQERYRNILTESLIHENEFISNPSDFSFGALLEIILHIKNLADNESKQLTLDSLPVITIENEYEEEGYYPLPGEDSIDLMLLFFNGQDGTQRTPASNFIIDIAIDEEAAKYCRPQLTHFEEDFTLSGGEKSSVKLPLPLTKNGVNSEQPFVITLNVQYKNVMGQNNTVTKEINIRIKNQEEFTPIPNLYDRSPLSPGKERAELFHGRDEDLRFISDKLLSGQRGGKTVLIYGQYRSGKSTLLNFLVDKLKKDDPSVIIADGGSVISLDKSWDIINKIITAIAVSFRHAQFAESMGEFIQTYRRPCATESDYSIYFSQFAQDLRDCLENNNMKNLRIIVKLDEFGRFLQSEKSIGFMQLWKSIMEMGVFDAIFVGHDVITQIIRKETNPFGIITLHQINYINRSSAVNLITQPTFRTDKQTSRYTDGAVDYIWKLSGGNVFYLQEICGYAVKFMNTYRINIVNEKYVQQAIKEQLATIDGSGTETLGHPLFQSGEQGESEELIGRAKIILNSIIKCSEEFQSSTREQIERYTSEHFASYFPSDEDIREAIESLFYRKVIEKDDRGNYYIRVGFYAEYLNDRIIAPYEH